MYIRRWSLYLNNKYLNTVFKYNVFKYCPALIVSPSDEIVIDIKKELKSKFNMKDLGTLNYFLGVKVVRNSEGYFLSEENFISNLLSEFNFDHVKPISTPVDANSFLLKANEDSVMCDKLMYQRAVGSLLYLSTRTRHDISFTVGRVSRYCPALTNQHWAAVKRIFWYLQGTKSFGLLFKSNSSSNCYGYSDADWGGDRDDRKSTSGFCFMLENL